MEVAGDGLSLRVRDEGRGQPVLLLHGFPDSSHVWRHQIDALTSAGMRAIAPDLRGFGESDKPAAVEDHAIARSVADMVCSSCASCCATPPISIATSPTSRVPARSPLG